MNKVNKSILFFGFFLFLTSCDNVLNRDASVEYSGGAISENYQALLQNGVLHESACPSSGLLEQSENTHRFVTEQNIELLGRSQVILEQVIAIQGDEFYLEFFEPETQEWLDEQALDGLNLLVCESLQGEGGVLLKRVKLEQVLSETKENQRLALQGYAGKTLVFVLLNLSDQKKEFVLDVQYSKNEGQAQAVFDRESMQKPASGFLDLHLHQTGAMAFNQGWYWGSHEIGSLEDKLPDCRGEHASMFEYEHYLDGKITGPIAYSIAPRRDVDDFMRSHRDMTQSKDYVRSNDRKHQLVAYERLKEAHERGLNLIVSTVVENNTLLDIMYNANKGRSDWYPAVMASIQRQVMSLKKIDEESEWFEIVYDPWHARRAINEGKLAVVLGAEFTDIFPPSDGPWRQQLFDLYELGLRHLQPVHKSDSQFSSTHDQGFPFDNLNLLRALIRKEIPNWPALERSFGQSDPETGLSQAGYDLLDEMIRLNMIVDLSHASLSSQIQMTDYLVNDNNYYPFIYSHWHARKPELLEQLKSAGGMIPFGWGQPVPTLAVALSDNDNIACQDFVAKRAALYQDYVAYGVKFSLASDMNGFTGTTQPNFGPKACELTDDQKDRSDQSQTWENMKVVYPEEMDWVTRYWAQGTADISLLPGIIYDLREVRGMDTSALDNSTEDFIQMWERAYDPEREAVK